MHSLNTVLLALVVLCGCAPQGSVDRLEAARNSIVKPLPQLDPLSQLQQSEVADGEALCGALQDLDSDQYDALCVKTGLGDYLKSQRGGQSGGNAGEAGPSPANAPPPASPAAPDTGARQARARAPETPSSGGFASLAVGERLRYVEAIAEEIRSFGGQIGDAAARGAWAALISLEARAEIMRQDLLSAVDEKTRTSVPDDALALVPREAIKNVLNEVDARIREMRLAATLTERADYVVTIDTLTARKEAAASYLNRPNGDWVGENRAKLAKALDTSAWDASVASAEERVTVLAEARMKEAQLSMPGLRLTAVGANGPRGPPELVAITQFWNDPAAYIGANAHMRAEYERTKPRSAETTEFHRFMASRLSDASLVLATHYVYNEQQRTYAESVPDRPSASTAKAKSSALYAVLISELKGPRSPPPHSKPPGSTPPPDVPPTRPSGGAVALQLPAAPGRTIFLAAVLRRAISSGKRGRAKVA